MILQAANLCSAANSPPQPCVHIPLHTRPRRLSSRPCLRPECDFRGTGSWTVEFCSQFKKVKCKLPLANELRFSALINSTGPLPCLSRKPPPTRIQAVQSWPEAVRCCSSGLTPILWWLSLQGSLFRWQGPLSLWPLASSVARHELDLAGTRKPTGL